MPSRRRSLYLAVKEQILGWIRAGKYPPDSRLPREEILAEEVGVSRPTLREALRLLEEEGIVRRIHGVGTFVRSSAASIPFHLEVNLAVTEMVSATGQTPGTSQQQVSEVVAGPDLAGPLQVPEGAPVVLIRRVRTANGRPIACAVDAVPRWVIPGPDLPEVQGSLYHFLEQRCGQPVSEGVARILPGQVGTQMAADLQVPAGTLALLVEQVDTNPGGRPILFSRECYVKDMFEFRINRRARL